MTTASHPLSVLIVEDNHDGADTLALLVRAAGHDARTAYAPAAAGALVRDGYVPDAVLLDIGLPGLDGYEVGRELCDALPRRPLLVAVTGYGNLDDRSRREGFDHHFLKPVDPTALLDVLSAYSKR